MTPGSETGAPSGLTPIERVRLAFAMADAGYDSKPDIEDVEVLLAEYTRLSATSPVGEAPPDDLVSRCVEVMCDTLLKPMPEGVPHYQEAVVRAILKEARTPPAASVEVEELKDFIQSASFSSRSADDGDTIFCQIYTPGYPPQHKGSFGFYVKDLRAILLLLTRGPDQGEVVQTSIATKQPTDPEIRSATETALTLDFVRLGVKAGLLMAAADCGNHAEGCMEDAMTSAGLAAHDKKMLDAECNAADAIQKQIKETCEDSALGYAAYMLPDEDHAALAVLGVTSDWLYRRTTGEPSRKELLDPVAPRAVAETHRAGSAGLSPGDGFSDPAPSRVEER